MKKGYDESEFFVDSPEEQAQAQNEETMRRIARTEFRRINSGQAEEDIAEDIRIEEQNKAEEQPKQLPPFIRAIQLYFTGEILASKKLEGIYQVAFIMVVGFAVAIALLFWSLNLEVECNRLATKVEILHEKSIRMKEIRYKATTAKSMMENLQKRGVTLYDPEKPPYKL